MSVRRWLVGVCLALASPAGVSAAAGPTRFTVVDAGTMGKPDLILIPGLTSSRAVWADEAARLAPDYRLHLVQVNGFAGQPAGANATGDALLPAIVEDLHAYIAAGGMHPMVVGHSMGGLLALMLAKAHPGDVARMVIVDAQPFYGLMFGPQATVESVAPMARAMRDGALHQSPAQRDAVARATAEMLVLNPGWRRQVAEDSLSSDPHVMAQAMYEDLQTDLRPELATIRTPTLVLYAFDPTLTFPNGNKAIQEVSDAITTSAYRTMPNVRLERVDGSRHFIMFDQPQRLDALLRAFLSAPSP